MTWWATALVAAAALALSTGVGWPLTAAVLRLAARSADAGAGADTGTASQEVAPAADDVADGPTGARARAALRGGTWIGLLERTAVTGALLLGYPAGLALVVAVKGLGRYPELREHPGSSERFVIGTLASMLWAAAVGAAARAVLTA